MCARTARTTRVPHVSNFFLVELPFRLSLSHTSNYCRNLMDLIRTESIRKMRTRHALHCVEPHEHIDFHLCLYHVPTQNTRQHINSQEEADEEKEEEEEKKRNSKQKSFYG